MGDDAGARAGQDSQRGVREPRIRFHFSLQSVYDMSFKTCNATEALCKIKSSRSIDVPSRRRGEDEGRVGTPEPKAVRQHRAYSLLSFRFERHKISGAQIAKTGIQTLEVQRRRDGSIGERQDRERRLDRPGRAKQVPRRALRRRHRKRPGREVISEDPTQSGELRGVSHDGAGGVRVDVSHVRGFDSRVGQSGPHRQTRAVSVTGRLRDVVRVARLSVPSHLRIRNGTLYTKHDVTPIAHTGK